MDVLDFDDWPIQMTGIKELHPLLAKAIDELKTGAVVRFTDADLEDLPNKTLVLLEQRLRNLAKQNGFRITVLHRGPPNFPERAMYVRRNNIKRK